MKIYKSFLFATALAGALLTSCSDEGIWDQASQAELGQVNGTTYAFNASSASYAYEPNDVMLGNDVELTITRGTTVGNFTLPIQAVFTDTSLIDGPKEVYFENGNNTAIYTIKIKKEFEIGDEAKATLTIDPENLGIPAVKAPTEPVIDSTGVEKKIDAQGVAWDSIYSTHEDSVKYESAMELYNDSLTNYNTYAKRLANYKLSTTVSFSKVYNWKKLGMATYRDDCFTTFWSVDNLEYQLELLECVQVPGYYRLVNPYGEAYGYNDPGDWDDSQDYYLEVHAEDPTAVWIDRSETGTNWGYGTIWIWSYAGYYMANRGYSVQDAKNDGMTGTLKDGVITFPSGSLLIGMENYNDLSYYNANGSGLFRIVMPGVVLADYSAEVAYAGLFTDVDNSVYVLGDLTLGPDATNVKAVVMGASEDAAAVADAIAAGDLEAIDVQAGRIQLPMPEGANGKLQIIVAVIANDEVQAVATSKFEYFGGGENPWQSLGVGLFTDDVFWSFFTSAGASRTYEVEIEESTTSPGVYRLKKPFAVYASWWQTNGQEGDGDADIEVNAEDPTGVYILNQPIGLTHSALGDISFETEGGYYMGLGKYTLEELKAYDLMGTVEDGIITFPVFPETDEEGNIQTDEEGNPYLYQGWLNFSGGKYYTTGANGEIQIVLPEAVTESARRAAHAYSAPNFGVTLSGGMNFHPKKAVKNMLIKSARVASLR